MVLTVLLVLLNALNPDATFEPSDFISLNQLPIVVTNLEFAIDETAPDNFPTPLFNTSRILVFQPFTAFNAPSSPAVIFENVPDLEIPVIFPTNDVIAFPALTTPVVQAVIEPTAVPKATANPPNNKPNFTKLVLSSLSDFLDFS